MHEVVRTHGITHLAWCVMFLYAGSTGYWPKCASMDAMASNFDEIAWSKMVRSGSGPTTQPLLMSFRPGLTASRLALALAISCTASVNNGLDASTCNHSHVSGVQIQYHFSDGIFFSRRVKIPA